MDDKEILLEHFDRLSPTVNRHAEVITPEDIGQEYLFHISKNTGIKEFVPLIGFRQAKTEDRTLPRICVAPTILGCAIAYAAVEEDFFSFGAKERKEKKWHGGYKIYGFKFAAAVVPNPKLVYDQAATGETWLVSYSEDTTKYVPEDFGRMFVRSTTWASNGKTQPNGVMELFVEVKHEAGITFAEGVKLGKGYYRIDGPTPQSAGVTYKAAKKYVITTIDKAEYLSNKRAVADTLGYKEQLPNFMRW